MLSTIGLLYTKMDVRLHPTNRLSIQGNPSILTNDNPFVTYLNDSNKYREPSRNGKLNISNYKDHYLHTTPCESFIPVHDCAPDSPLLTPPVLEVYSAASKVSPQ